LRFETNTTVSLMREHNNTHAKVKGSTLSQTTNYNNRPSPYFPAYFYKQ